MPIIEVINLVNAPIDRVFDLSRCVDPHTDSMSKYRERAIGGVTSGLLALGDSITWEATHLGLRQTLMAVITEFNRPVHFQDSMLEGAFSSFFHDHCFEETKLGTLMPDIINYRSPYSVIGEIFDLVFLMNYVREMIAQRNQLIRSIAEGNDWVKYLDENSKQVGF